MGIANDAATWPNKCKLQHEVSSANKRLERVRTSLPLAQAFLVSHQILSPFSFFFSHLLSLLFQGVSVLLFYH